MPALPFSPASDRNKVPILAVLESVLDAESVVLEIASGTGQHAAYFAAAQPGWHWQPTDADPACLPAIAQRCAGLANVRAPVALDVLAEPWPPQLERPDAIYCANMLHIAPWACCAALMQGVARVSQPGALLVLYGPYIVDGEPTMPGNLAFDTDLRARDPAWGLRRLSQVIDTALAAGLRFERRVAMPANNLMLLFRRGDGTPPGP